MVNAPDAGSEALGEVDPPDATSEAGAVGGRVSPRAWSRSGGGSGGTARCVILVTRRS
ncbi:hypothetical protein GCM10023083_79520 [Streptomyces phyllanthi]